MSRIHAIGINRANGRLQNVAHGDVYEDVAATTKRRAVDYNRLFYIREGFEVDYTAPKTIEEALTIGEQQPVM